MNINSSCKVRQGPIHILELLVVDTGKNEGHMYTSIPPFLKPTHSYTKIAKKVLQRAGTSPYTTTMEVPPPPMSQPGGTNCGSFGSSLPYITVGMLLFQIT